MNALCRRFSYSWKTAFFFLEANLLNALFSTHFIEYLNQNSVMIMSTLITAKILNVLRISTLWQKSDSFCTIQFLFSPTEHILSSFKFHKWPAILGFHYLRERCLSVQLYLFRKPVLSFPSHRWFDIGSTNSIVFMKTLETDTFNSNMMAFGDKIFKIIAFCWNHEVGRLIYNGIIISCFMKRKSKKDVTTLFHREASLES